LQAADEPKPPNPAEGSKGKNHRFQGVGPARRAGLTGSGQVYGARRKRCVRENRMERLSDRGVGVTQRGRKHPGTFACEEGSALPEGKNDGRRKK